MIDWLIGFDIFVDNPKKTTQLLYTLGRLFVVNAMIASIREVSSLPYDLLRKNLMLFVYFGVIYRSLIFVSSSLKLGQKCMRPLYHSALPNDCITDVINACRELDCVCRIAGLANGLEKDGLECHTADGGRLRSGRRMRGEDLLLTSCSVCH